MNEQMAQQQSPEIGGQPQSAGMQKSPQFLDEFKGRMDMAKDMLYDKGFEQMVELFQKSGKQGFADAMGMIVPTTIEQMEEQGGEMNPNVIMMTMVGMVAMIGSDMISGGVVPDADQEDIQLAISNCMAKWAEANEDRADLGGAVEQMNKEAMKQKQGGGAEGMGLIAQQSQSSGMGV